MMLLAYMSGILMGVGMGSLFVKRKGIDREFIIDSNPDAASELSLDGFLVTNKSAEVVTPIVAFKEVAKTMTQEDYKTPKQRSLEIRQQAII